MAENFYNGPIEVIDTGLLDRGNTEILNRYHQEVAAHLGLKRKMESRSRDICSVLCARSKAEPTETASSSSSSCCCCCSNCCSSHPTLPFYSDEDEGPESCMKVMDDCHAITNKRRKFLLPISLDPVMNLSLVSTEEPRENSSIYSLSDTDEQEMLNNWKAKRTSSGYPAKSRARRPNPQTNGGTIATDSDKENGRQLREYVFGDSSGIGQLGSKGASSAAGTSKSTDSDSGDSYVDIESISDDNRPSAKKRRIQYDFDVAIPTTAPKKRGRKPKETPSPHISAAQRAPIPTGSTAAGRKPKQSGKSGLDKEKQKHLNQLEQYRRMALSQNFTHLRSILPELDEEPKAPRQTVLDTAISHIKKLQADDDKKTQEIDHLKKMRKQLEMKLEMLKRGSE